MAKILIVDDSSFTRNLIGRMVRQGGHEVVGTAGDGSEAVKLFKSLQPELVTLDYLMPDSDGEAVLGEIMAHDPGARVIMISCSGDHTLEERALEAGAKFYLEKTNVPHDILSVIDQVMRA